MKRSFALSLACIALSGCYDPAANTVKAGGVAPKQGSVEIVETDRTLDLNSDNTTVRWTGSNVAGQTPAGYFLELTGRVTIDNKPQTLKAVDVTFDMTKVISQDKKLTKKLKENGFFEVAKFPTARFELTSISDGPREGDPDETTHVIEGNFQLKDVTKSIQIPVELRIDADNFGLNSEFSINRKDYGVVYENSVEDAAIRDGVVINLSIEIPPKDDSK